MLFVFGMHGHSSWLLLVPGAAGACSPGSGLGHERASIQITRCVSPPKMVGLLGSGGNRAFWQLLLSLVISALQIVG